MSLANISIGHFLSESFLPQSWQTLECPGADICESKQKNLTFQSRQYILLALDIWVHPGKTNTRDKHRAPRMHCGSSSAPFTHQRKKRNDYIIKTRRLSGANSFMLMVVLVTSVLTVQPGLSVLLFPLAADSFGYHMRLIVLDYLLCDYPLDRDSESFFQASDVSTLRDDGGLHSLIELSHVRAADVVACASRAVSLHVTLPRLQVQS